jgi:hypothetical protein
MYKSECKIQTAALVGRGAVTKVAANQRSELAKRRMINGRLTLPLKLNPDANRFFQSLR